MGMLAALIVYGLIILLFGSSNLGLGFQALYIVTWPFMAAPFIITKFPLKAISFLGLGSESEMALMYLLSLAAYLLFFIGIYQIVKRKWKNNS